MKHVKLFESFNTMISPEEFEAGINKAKEMGHIEGGRYIRNAGKANPGMPMSRAHTYKIKTFVDSLSPEQLEDIRNDYSQDERYADRMEREKMRMQGDAEEKARKSMERKQKFVATKNAMKSDILDRFAAGEITKEEALAAL